ncbi:MAG TPA: DUF262 domain-containing protein [Candidatus Brocadiaceae bacterium]
MSKKITFNDLEIQKLFQNFYIIPAYQREYIWQEKEVIQLLEDVHDAFSDNPEAEYFLGSLVVCKSTEGVKLEVIDGQQRLITLSLVLNNIKRQYKKNKTDCSSIEKLLYSATITETGETVHSNIIEIQYEGKEVLYDLYKTDDDETINPKMIEGLPGKTIFDAHRHISSFFENNFSPEDSFARIKKFLGYLLNKVKVIQIETPEIGNALKIFETINERGISLDQVDLLKNLLFIQIERKQFAKLAKEWDKFKKSVVGQKVSEKPLRFLRYFIMANYDVAKDQKGERESVVREDDIYEWFVKNEAKCNYKSNASSFVRKLHENADFYINLLRNRYHSDNNINLENQSKLLGNAFRQHLLILLSANALKKAWFNHLVGQLENVLFFYNITKEPPRDIEKRFASWTSEIRNIKSIVNLNDFIQNRLLSELDARMRSFESNFITMDTSSMQKYKLKYILAKLTDFIENLRVGEQKESSIVQYLKSSIQIEHILPDNPLQELIDVFSNGDKKEYDIYKNKIGNLTLLERPINESIQRDFFDKKKPEYSKSKFCLTRSISNIETVGSDTSINRANELLQSFDVWDKNSIDARSKMLLNISKLIWKVEPFKDNN